MRKLLKCEYLKTNRRHIILSALFVTAIACVWAFYDHKSGDAREFMLQNGWYVVLYQFPLINSIFFPLLSVIIASRLCDLEHKGSCLKLICTLTPRGRLYDAKLLYGMLITQSCVILFWAATIIYGALYGFRGSCPISLYLLYLLFTLTPTAAVYCFQHALSMIFKNPAVPFFTGILGEFVGLFTMFLPQYPLLRRTVIWGYYGALQFVGMYGYTKETRYTYAYMEHMGYDWTSFGVLIALTIGIYLIGKKIFCRKEL
ncbi:MAG: ABC transporter permease [Butyrivibrio sp.]|nr:ABC transporter permease [Muribaculum sp.]MCM1551743.1 ABC transporter permease [Butyrivibrio sp.]